MVYETISREEGMKCFPSIKNLVLAGRDDYFVEPFNSSFLKLRCRCLFKKDRYNRDVIYFHLADEEKFLVLEPLSDMPVYFYGAYNYVEVVQMRAQGPVRIVEKNEKLQVIDLIKQRFDGIVAYDKLPDPQPSLEEKGGGTRAARSGHGLLFPS